MNKLAKEIIILEKKIKLIEDNYSVFASILDDIDENLYMVNLLEKYKSQLRSKNLERSRKIIQIDLEDSINEIKGDI